MRILSAELRDLVTFRCARISTLSITFTDKLQLILGTNGCGKSNLLRQLGPLPPVRSDFLDGTGYKKLVIEHDGQEFTLISDFSRKDSPHEFILGGVNINDGGTTEVQKELVLRHLGWTPDVETLCFNQFDFSSMGGAQREALFMKLNPYKINFILENAKKAKSRLRGCKTMIARLLERKVRLEGQLLPEENIQALQAEQATLLDQSGFLSKMIIKAETAQSHTLQQSVLHATDPEETLSRMVADLKLYIPKLRFRMEDWSHVDRERPDEQLEESLGKLATYIARQNEYLHQLQTLTEALRVDNENLAECADEEFITRLNLELQTLESKLAEKLKIAPEDPFTPAFLRKYPAVNNTLTEILDSFVSAPPDLMSRRDFHRKRQQFDHWVIVLRNTETEIQNLENQIAEEKKRFTISIDDIPTDTCGKSRCPLFNSFMAQSTRVEQSIQRAEHQKAIMTRRVDRLSAYLEGMSNKLREQDPYLTKLHQLSELVVLNPELNQFFSRPDTLVVLVRNPHAFSSRIHAHYEGSKAALEIPTIKEEILKAQLEYSKHKSMSDKEKTHLTSMIKETTSKIEKVNRRLKGCQADVHRMEEEVRNIRAFRRAQHELRDYEKILGELNEELHRRHEWSKLGDLIKSFSEGVRSMTNRLGDIQRVIKEQESLWARYREEVIGTIEELELEKNALEQIGEALEALPQDYTVQFMNRLFKSANAFVTKVFTYKLALFPMVPERSKNFKMPYSARGTDGPDISKCSTAQKDILNLCLALACRQSEGLCDYPLFLDEVGRTFDPTHQHNLLNLFMFICDENMASQLFIVNHHAAIHGGLMNTETLVLDDSNVMKTESYNTHAVIENY